ncbi:DinB family protein [Algivirga pacifica]|uniref:DinB family protein n=1 Tax=Algivirga pacifica TaxID=1162670 RepID=A0ABP9D553_9BACT
MEQTIRKLEQLLEVGVDYIGRCSQSDLNDKPNPEKWSKKEIIGHLIDSGINNLQRFTEIQFECKPYRIRKYNQDELVIANSYQKADIKEIVGAWVAVNNRIQALMKQQSEETLGFEIVLGNGAVSDLKFLMEDYVEHLEHHLKQITKG